MARLRRLSPDELNFDQQALYGKILSGQRVAAAGTRRLTDDEGRLGGPFNIWLRSPVLGEAWSYVGETLRFSTKLDRRIFELVIAIVAAHYRCAYEWAAHRPLAEKAGVESAALTALREGETPRLDRADEAAAYAGVRAILTDGRLDSQTFALLLEQFGEEGTFELVSTVGYYLSLALTLNVFAVEPPPGFTDPWDLPS